MIKRIEKIVLIVIPPITFVFEPGEGYAHRHHPNEPSVPFNNGNGTTVAVHYFHHDRPDRVRLLGCHEIG
jgi:hypothetical protein